MIENLNNSGATVHDERTILRIVGGPDSGKEYPLLTAEVTVGRSSACEIAVGDNMLSRQHIRLVRNGRSWDLIDLGSTNGTWLKGERLQGRVSLTPKLPVRIGQTLFEITGHADDVDVDALDEKLISYREAVISAANMEPLGGEKNRHAQMLAAIYRLQGLMTDDINRDDLYARILELITDAIHADNAYFLIWSEDSQSMVPVAERNQFGPIPQISSEFLSRSIIDFVREKNEAIISLNAQSDERFHGESLDGTAVSCVMCVPMIGRQGPVGMIYVISTQPDRKYHQDELKLLNAIGHSAAMVLENMRLMDSNVKSQRLAAIGMTAASLSHYVKNILNGLEGSIALLRMGIDGNDKTIMDQSWDILSNNEKRLSTLMLDLLSLAKEQKPNFAKYNVAEIIVDAAELLRQQCKEENILFEIDEAVTRKLINAEIDGQGIHRVILNLVNNSIDSVRDRHLEKDTGRIRVNIKADHTREEVDIMITDNGNGLSAMEVEKMFDEFHTGKGECGTGLGLAVSRRIVDAHNGRIEVESGKGDGATFHVILPLSQDVNRTQTLKVSGIRDSQKIKMEEGIHEQLESDPKKDTQCETQNEPREYDIDHSSKTSEIDPSGAA